MLDSERAAIVDEEHLRLLRLGFFVGAGESALFGLMGVFYAFMGLAFGAIARHAGAPTASQPPAAVTWIFVAIGSCMFLFFGTMAALKLRVAKCIRLRTSHGLCIAVAVVTCFGVPYGTMLGVGAFIVLTKPSIKALFLAT